MQDEQAWFTVSASTILVGSGQDSAQASHILPHQTLSPLSFWTLLCSLVRGMLEQDHQTRPSLDREE